MSALEHRIIIVGLIQIINLESSGIDFGKVR